MHSIAWQNCYPHISIKPIHKHCLKVKPEHSCGKKRLTFATLSFSKNCAIDESSVVPVTSDLELGQVGYSRND